MLYDILPPLFLFASLGGIIVIVSRVMLRVRRETFSREMRAVALAPQAATRDQDLVFRPGAGKIQLVKNRLSLIPTMMASTAAGVRGAAQNLRDRRQKRSIIKKAAKHTQKELASQAAEKSGLQIHMPELGWRDKLAEATHKSKQAVVAVGQRMAANVPRRITFRDPQDKARELSATVRPRTRLITRPARPKDSVSPETVIQSLAAPPPPSPPELAKSTAKQPAEQKPNGVISRVLRKKEAPVDSLSRARAVLQEKKYDQAEDILIPYIVQHSKDAQAYLLLGQAALGQEAWEEAIEIFQQVFKIDSSQPGIYALLGRAAFEARKFTLAIQSLQRAHDEDPANADVLQMLLVIAQLMDNKILEKSVRSDLAELPAVSETRPPGRPSAKQPVQSAGGN